MRKTWIGIIAVLLVLAGVAFWYVAPQENLNLNYESFAVSDKIKEMMTTKQLEFHLTQTDVNNLLVQRLASQSSIATDWRVTGARFELQDSQLIAHINLLYHGKIPVGTTAYYQLSWEAPYLKATPLYAQIRNWKLPSSLIQLPAPSISVQSFFPTFIKARDVQFEPHSILFRLKF